MSSASESETARDAESFRFHYARSQWKRSPRSAETSLTAECMQITSQELRYGRSASSVTQSRPAGYGRSRYSDSLAVSAAFKRSSTLPPALPDDDCECYRSGLAAFPRSAFIKEEHQAGVFLYVEEAMILRELVRNCGAQ